MREQVIQFGAEGNLVGILAEPAGGSVADRPVVLLYDIGFEHRVGPYRLNVELARELAARGFTSLRFDLSGLGDSEPRAVPADPLERSAADLADAMAVVTRRCGIGRFALLTLCSGVDAGHVVAVRDSRIVAAAFIDGYAYLTVGHQLHRVLGLWTDPARGWRWLIRWFRPPPRESGDGFFDRVYPTQADFRRQVLGMAERGTRLFFLFSYHWWFFNHRGQFREMLGVRRLPPSIEVEYWADTDHVFTGVGVRRRLVCRLSGWLASHFSTAPQTATSGKASHDFGPRTGDRAGTGSAPCPC